MVIDLHVHSTFSRCSSLTLSQAVEAALRSGLDGICITDHGTMAASREIQEGLQPSGLVVIVGIEYTTPQGDFLLFGPFESLEPGLDAKELLPLVEGAGGVAVAAHPFRPGRSVDPSLPRWAGKLLVEGLNGRTAPEYNRAAALWAERWGLPLVGGSDAHSPEEVGRVTVELPHLVRSRAELIRVLREGRVRGPFRRALGAGRPAEIPVVPSGMAVTA